LERVVLIVEDESTNRKLLHDVLVACGCQPIEATNGRQAVELAKEKKPSVVIMDIEMPVMNGLDAVRLLKSDAVTSSIPVIALTAYATNQDRDRVLQAGFDDYLSKPVDIWVLRKKVEEYLERS